MLTDARLMGSPADRAVQDEPESDLSAIDRMVDEGGPVPLAPPSAVSRCAVCGAPKMARGQRCAQCAERVRSKALLEPVPSSVDVAEAGWRTARGGFRVYCFACSRSSTAESPSPRGSRCTTCGGTMLSEPETIF
jgi:hypothetical protein